MLFFKYSNSKNKALSPFIFRQIAVTFYSCFPSDQPSWPMLHCPSLNLLIPPPLSVLLRKIYCAAFTCYPEIVNSASV